MVTIGIDAHKRSHTVVIVDEQGHQLAARTVGTTSADHLELVAWAARFAERRWAVEVKRVETRRLLFAREPLREPAIVEIATEEHRLRLALDALGNPGPADCEDPRCVASR